MKYVKAAREGLQIFQRRFGSFSDLFSRFSNHFSYPIKILSGAAAFCRSAALRLLVGNRRNTVSRVLFQKRELAEFCGELGEFCEKLDEFTLTHKQYARRTH